LNINHVFVLEFCQKKESNNNSQRLLRALQLLLLLLPFDNLVLLKDIIKLLHFTAKHSDKNRMPPDNLATLFTGHLIVPRKVYSSALMLLNYTLLPISAFIV